MKFLLYENRTLRRRMLPRTNEDFVSGYIWYATSHGFWGITDTTDIRKEAEEAYKEYKRESQ